jgi:ATP-dependent RNA helicase RhlE
MTFSELGLAAPILSALAAKGYDTPTPIQLAAIPHVMAGTDLLGLAQTGTGKTAAFALPVLHRFLAKPRKAEPKTARALVLAPTRELAAQIAASFQTYSKGMRLRVAVVFGGVPINRQMRAMDPGVDVLVATPGRLLDLINQRGARLDRVDTLILDEADHMLDLGFILPLKKIRAMLPKERQTLLFSATMPKEIAALAGEFLTNPVRVEATPVASTPERVAQRVIQVSSHGAKQAELQTLLSGADVTRALVFTRTKHGADRVVQKLYEAGIDAHAIHGNKKQNHRERALEAFRSGRTRVLVATDIAARGIDVAEISHVVQYDLPEVPETYVHRIGRTARAGAAGQAIALCAPDENQLLRAAERLMGVSVSGPRPEGDHPYARPKPRPRPAGSTQARGPRPPQRARSFTAR